MFEHYYAVLKGKEKPKYKAVDIEEKVRRAKQIFESCALCEHRCGVNRYRERGFCRVGAELRVASYFLHWGEERFLVPSGTIFFSSCNFRCVYCQNYDISQFPKAGTVCTPTKLARIMEELERRGAKNINLVGGDPTPYIPLILEALLHADLHIPLIWNSNLYLTPEALDLILGVIDLWLPDFKYGNDICALRLSSAPNYWQVITRNLDRLVRAGEEILVRHLVLPGHIECCTEPVLRWLGERGLPVNVMYQYHPEWKAAEFGVGRQLTWKEIERVEMICEELGINRVE